MNPIAESGLKSSASLPDLGLIATRGDPRLNGDATLVGADFDYVNNRFLGRRVLTARSSIQHTDTDWSGGTGTATTFALGLPNEPFELHWFYNRIDDRYDPALGFVPRTGVQNASFYHGWAWNRGGGARLRRFSLFSDAEFVLDLDGRRLDRELERGARPGFPDCTSRLDRHAGRGKETQEGGTQETTKNGAAPTVSPLFLIAWVPHCFRTPRDGGGSERRNRRASESGFRKWAHAA